MRKKEQKFWDRMRHALKDKVYLERVENVISPGRPDVDSAWSGIIIPLELKYVENFPVRDTTPVLGSDGLNQNQRNWWLNWRRWGGKGFIVIGVEREVFVVPGALSDKVNAFDRKQLFAFLTTWPELIEKIRKESQCLQDL